MKQETKRTGFEGDCMGGRVYLRSLNGGGSYELRVGGKGKWTCSLGCKYIGV